MPFLPIHCNEWEKYFYFLLFRFLWASKENERRSCYVWQYHIGTNNKFHDGKVNGKMYLRSEFQFSTDNINGTKKATLYTLTENRMYHFFRRLYFAIPFKAQGFRLVRIFYKPSVKIAGYLKFKGNFEIKLPHDKSITLWNNNSTLSSLFFWKGLKAYESGSLKVWIALSRNAKNVIDVGANFGLFGIISACYHNSAYKIIFFEPLKRNSDLIRKNCTLNKLDIQIVEAAVSNQTGKVTFYDMASEENTIGSLREDFVKLHSFHSEIIPTELPCITIDDYVSANNVIDISMMKIDVEGAEMQVYEGMKELILQQKPIILSEINQSKPEDVIRILRHELFKDYSFFQICESYSNPRITCKIENRPSNFLFVPNEKLEPTIITLENAGILCIQ